MINYKQWKSMNESFVGTFATVVSNPAIVGGIVGGLDGTRIALEEAKKKKKHMDAGTPGKEEDGETGDGEVVDAASEKDAEKGDEKGDGDDKGKKLPPWLQKKEAKSAASFDPEGDKAGKVLPWLNRKGNHGSVDKKNASDKLTCISDKVKKESEEAVNDLFFATLRGQMGSPGARNANGFTEISAEQMVPAKRSEPDAEPEPGQVGFAPNSRIFQLAGMTDDEGTSLIDSIPTIG